MYTMGFLTQWKVYLDQLPAGPDARAYKGKKLDPTIFEKVRESWPSSLESTPNADVLL